MYYFIGVSETWYKTNKNCNILTLSFFLIHFLHFQASGVKVSEEVKQKYDDIKKKKCHRYLVFYIKDEKIISVEKIGKYFHNDVLCKQDRMIQYTSGMQSNASYLNWH